MAERLIIYSDGCSKGNPGPAAIGVAIYEDNRQSPILLVSDKIGSATNNQAEYRALINALEYAVSFKATEVEVRSDSELIVNQMNGIYRVKNRDLRPLFIEAKRLAGLIAKFRIISIPREHNRQADKLANIALNKSI